MSSINQRSFLYNKVGLSETMKFYYLFKSNWVLALTMFALATFGATTLVLAEVSDAECDSCRIRKQRLCVIECAAAPYPKQAECRNSCVNEYCTHRCKSTLDYREAPNCQECTASEIPLCKPLCTKGTPDAIAECSQMCGNLRCQAICQREKSENSNLPHQQ